MKPARHIPGFGKGGTDVLSVDGKEPQPGGARQSAAWTCCGGWVRLKPQVVLHR